MRQSKRTSRHIVLAATIALLMSLTLFVGPAPAFVFDGDATNGSIVVTTGDGLVHWLKHDPLSQIQGQFSTNVSVDGGVTDIPKALAVGDFDGDNNGDILIARSGGDLGNPNTGFLTWVERSGTSLTGVHSFNVSPAHSIAIGELGDGKFADVVVGRDDGYITWSLKSNGFDAITANHTFNEGTVSAVAIGNFDGDANGDVLVAKPSGLHLNWAERNAGDTLSGIHNFNISPTNSIAIGNGDGDLQGIDEVFVGRDDGWITWASWNQSQSSPQITACPNCNYNAGGVVDLAFENVLTGDLNGDTSGDLFVVRPDGELLWLKTDAFNLNIQSQDQITAGAGLGTSLTSVDAGDFDGDGNIDIIVGRSTAGGTSGNVGWYEVLETSPDIFEIVLQQEMFNLGAAVLDLQIIAPEASASVDSADFDVDLDVDGEDFLTWQRGLVQREDSHWAMPMTVVSWMRPTWRSGKHSMAFQYSALPPPPCPSQDPPCSCFRV